MIQKFKYIYKEISGRFQLKVAFKICNILYRGVQGKYKCTAINTEVNAKIPN